MHSKIYTKYIIAAWSSIPAKCEAYRSIEFWKQPTISLIAVLFFAVCLYGDFFSFNVDSRYPLNAHPFILSARSFERILLLDFAAADRSKRDKNLLSDSSESSRFLTPKSTSSYWVRGKRNRCVELSREK